MPRNWYEWSKLEDMKLKTEKHKTQIQVNNDNDENQMNKTDIYLVLHKLRKENLNHNPIYLPVKKDIHQHLQNWTEGYENHVNKPLITQTLSSNGTNICINKSKRNCSLSSEESNEYGSEDSEGNSFSRDDDVSSLSVSDNGLNSWYDNLKNSPEILYFSECSSRSSSISISASQSSVSKLTSSTEEMNFHLIDGLDETWVNNEHEIIKQLKEWLSQIGSLYGDPFWGIESIESSPINPRTAIRVDPYHGFENKSSFQFIWEGPVDKDGNFHGKGNVSFDDGGETCGVWNHGIRNGKGTTSCPDKNIKILVGEYKNGKLVGPGRIVYNNDETLECNFRDGCLHGLARLLTSRRKLSFCGRYCNGMPSGICWQLLPGGGYITGKVDSNGKFTGDNICYIYPDFTTCYFGVFKDSQIVQAKLSQIKEVRLHKGIMEIHPCEGVGSFLTYEISTMNWICSNLLQRDPYENQMIEVMGSGLDMAGEGVFAKKDLLPEIVVAFYNGVRIPADAGDEDDNWEDCSYRIFVEIDEDATDIECENCERMDMPEEYRSLDKYCATLAHKINHSFNPNCRFGKFHHPIFGPIPSVITTQFVPKGTELFCYYKYLLDDCPQWYADLWESK